MVVIGGSDTALWVEREGSGDELDGVVGAPFYDSDDELPRLDSGRSLARGTGVLETIEPVETAVERSGEFLPTPEELAASLRAAGPFERIDLLARLATSPDVDVRRRIATALRHVPFGVGTISAIEQLARDEVFEVRAAAAVTARLRLHDAPARLRALLARF